MNRQLLGFFLFVLGTTPIAALNVATGGAGTSGADFLTVGIGARELAMGGAFSAVDSYSNANAVNWNPSALGFVESPNVTASYNMLFKDESQGYFGFAAPASKDGGVWSVGVNYLMVSNVERRIADTENPDSQFTNQNLAVSGSYARALSSNFSIGGTLKYIRISLDTQKENAMAADFGALWKTSLENLNAAFVIRNLGSNIGPDSMPLNVKGGFAYKLISQKLLLDTDLDWIATERRAYPSFGAEYWTTPNLALRGGYQFGHGADQLQNKLVGLGVGLGVRFNNLSLDYAFMPYGDLGNTHRITVGMRFK